jgi:hypothetical protein
MIPFHCDALLPTAERYSSLKFRRVAQHFDGDASDAVELAAFLAIVPFRWARWIFHWPRRYVLPKVIWAPPEFIRANREALDLDTGFAVLHAMQDGGWRRGRLPDVVRNTVLELVHNGRAQVDVARELGLSQDQVQYVVKGRNTAASARAVAGLAIG